MPGGKLPGPLGLTTFHGCILHPPVIGGFPGNLRPWEIPISTQGPAGTNSDLSESTVDTTVTATDVTTEFDKTELELLDRVYGVVRRNKKRFKITEKKRSRPDVAGYVEERRKFFGSDEEYKTYLQLGIGELDADGEKLRKIVEPSAKVRKKHADWKQAQDIFYAWVRKAYEKAVAADVDIPKLIKAQSSEKVQEALKQVRLDYGHEFKAGGFNPRPMKIGGRYRLGTLSDHALGTAIDIDAKHNPHIEEGVWKAILSFTGKTLDHAKRKSLWKTNPEELHKSVLEISNTFVTKLAEAIKEAEKSASGSATPASATAGPPKKVPPKTASPLDTAIANHADLKKIGKSFLSSYSTGFLTLEWALLKELEEEGFLWGATFADPDLHHFQL